ncbi:cardiolipin synthase [Gudongella sp. DL1XJH-153]|uniref:cardiolipin synthase n=1 Tax=Gudongella sp. DL1XJH-153 TaxID=3409804 RepID=UPI003BB5DB6C
MESLFSSYMFIFSNLIWINILLALVLVFFERRNPTSTWLWLMVLLFLPVIGFILYLFVGQDMSKKKMFMSKANEDDCFDILLADQEKNFSTREFLKKNPEYKAYDDIVKLHLMGSNSVFTSDNEVDLYFSGEDKFKALLESIEKAEEYIHMEYYIFNDDNMGNIVMEALAQKAREGIEVKLLIDGMGSRRLGRRITNVLREAGGEVVFFFPPFIPVFNVRINYRNHRKICIVDGKEAYIGGFNVGDEYIGLSSKFGYWRDTHIRIKGSAISSMQWQFFLDWRFASGEEINGCQSYIGTQEEDNKVGIQIVSSGPDSKWPSIKDGYLKMINNAEKRLYIETPYFIPDDSIFEALRIAGLSGLDVRVMIPNKPDHPFVFWASLSYIGELLEAGVRFYTYERGFLHSKVMITDDSVSSVGTANLDIRSFNLNFEVNAFIYDRDTNNKLAERFVHDLENCKEITMETYKNRSRTIKIKESVSRLLSPIL